MVPEVGKRIDFYWPAGNQYYAGAKMSVKDDSMRVITYDD